MGLFAPDDDWDEDFDPVPPSIDVEIGGPEVIGELLGPKGEVMFFLVDRPVIRFGFCR